ncbi:ester cyclase [Natrinema gelatinilyticum]|uniref:ester cyclase n=1 Tax=Natrinema gelatinilyticum TaxID=2961571 RepID=UPI0020C342A9|nr:ester cyclase [Natrinema gelatinilyticum]
MITTPEENKEIVRKFPEEVISEQNIDLIDEIATEDVIDHHDTFGKTQGREALKETTEYLYEAFSGPSATVKDVVAESNRVAIRWSSRGIHEGEFMGFEPTGKAYVIEVTMFARMKDGKIAERWVLSDTLGMLQQFGVIEQPNS